MNAALTALSSPSFSGQHRRAALVLHALDAADRQWALEQLDTPHRLTLESALAELVALGIPADPALVDAALAAQDSSNATDPRIEFLCKQSTETVVRRLRGEPQVLIAMVLGLHPWPWASGVSAELCVEPLQGPVPRGMREDLLSEMVSRLASAGSAGIQQGTEQASLDGSTNAPKLRLVFQRIGARLGLAAPRGGRP